MLEFCLDVEDGGDWQVVRDFAAAHGQLEALNAFLEYAKGAVLHAEDIVGPESLEGIARETKRKLLRFDRQSCVYVTGGVVVSVSTSSE